MTAEPTKSDRMAGMSQMLTASAWSLGSKRETSDERRENEQEDVIRGNKSTKVTRHKRTTKKKEHCRTEQRVRKEEMRT